MDKKAVMVSYMESLNIIRAAHQKELGLELGRPGFESRFHHCVPLDKSLKSVRINFLICM